MFKQVPTRSRAERAEREDREEEILTVDYLRFRSYFFTLIHTTHSIIGARFRNRVQSQKKDLYTFFNAFAETVELFITRENMLHTHCFELSEEAAFQ